MPHPITPKTKLCLVIGDPVSHSLSPAIHNFAYQQLGISEQFIYLAAQVAPKDLASAVAGIRALGVRGVSCTMPHKSSILPYLDEVDILAQKIGAINTIVNNDGVLWGTNTDIVGVLKPLERAINISSSRFAIFGSGGAAKAAAIGLASQGGVVSIFSRNQITGQELADKVQGSYFSVPETAQLKSFDVLINATPVGMAPLEEVTPFNLKSEDLKNIKVVFDMVYNPVNTSLIKLARSLGITTISGLEMLLEQAVEQIRLFTGLTISSKDIDLKLPEKRC